MPEYADIYVLAKSRTGVAVSEFLDYFAPTREETADEYRIPQYSDSPHTIFRSSSEIISYCCSHISEPYSVYWKNAGNSGPTFAMVFFTSDGFLILGLSVDEGMDKRYFFELQKQTKSNIGYVTFECPPPGTAVEFCRLANQA
jgi:hypothetical protein